LSAPFIAALACSSQLLACSPDSEILTGRWQTRPVVPAFVPEGSRQELVAGGMDLTLGHYGPEVVGVVRFYARQLVFDDGCSINDVTDAQCGCVYLANGRWNEDRLRFTFRVDGEPPVGGSAAEGDLYCLPSGTADPPAGAPARLEFDLRLVEDDILVGEVDWVGSALPVQPLVWTRITEDSCDDPETRRCP
jgi:hypothetical protein